MDAWEVTPVWVIPQLKANMLGKRRRDMARKWDDEEHHPRVKVEIVFPVEKSVIGSHALARLPGHQRKELMFKVKACNENRVEPLSLIIIESFHKASLEQLLYVLLSDWVQLDSSRS